MRAVFVLTLLCGILCPSIAQTDDYELGVVIDSVRVSGAEKETFALYLPSSYRPEVLSPIVFIFHPGGSGSNAVSLFVKAAEKYGYVLVCSNNNKNGPQQQNFDYANRLFEHIFSNFNIDNNRIYTAGFSGGSRLATAIAVLTKRIQGVIACGSGFPGNVAPVGIENFSYAGIVGDRDMNYMEMKNNKKLLSALGVSNELFTYGIAHQWPTQDQLLVAFDWLQSEAHKKGLVELDRSELVELYQQALKRAELNYDPQNLIRLNERYERAANNFSSFFSVDSIVQKARALRATEAFKTQQRQYTEVLIKEQELADTYTQKLLEEIEKSKPNAQPWEKRISKILKQIEETLDHFEKRMFQRIIAQLAVTSYEAAYSRSDSLTLQQLMFCFDVWIYTAPERPYSYFVQMRNAMTIPDHKLTFNYLERLIASGYKDYRSIANFEPLDPLRNSAEYQEIIQRIKNDNE